MTTLCVVAFARARDMSDVHRERTARVGRHPRPRCDQYMRRHYAVADGRFLTREPGTWHLRDDGSRAYDVAPCRVVRYTAENARRCLRGRHLFFVGDSVTRYLVVTLVHFLERGEWPERLLRTAERCRKGPRTEACGTGPNIGSEHDWSLGSVRGWPRMLSTIGGGDDGSLFRGRVECLCARDDGLKARADGSSRTVQNVIYRSAHGVNVTAIEESGWKGTEPLQGWTPTGCADRGACRLPLAAHARNVARANADDYDWVAPVVEALEGPLKTLYPDVTDAFYNRGLWGPVKDPKAVFEALRGLTRPGGRCFWRGTTASSRSRDEADVREAAFKKGCETFDAQLMTKAFEELLFKFPFPPAPEIALRERKDVYTDLVHFMPWVYEEVNNLLLNVLCNGDASWERQE